MQIFWLNKLILFISFIVFGFLLSSCSLFPRINILSQDDRLQAFPRHNLPLQGPASLYWNSYQVPYVWAEKDEDLAFLLGMVHAHLRLSQMTFMKYISYGRLSELAGPLTRDIDHSLRIFNFPKTAHEILASLPEDSQKWLNQFVKGLNFYQEQLRELPADLKIAGIHQLEPWTQQDVLAIGRLAGADVTWFLYITLLRLPESDRQKAWNKIINGEHDTQISQFYPDLLSFGRTGSNSAVIGSSLAANKAPLIANDPHLGLNLPNTWFIVGLRSQKRHMVGLTLPGLPFIALGRNPQMAWGGTNLRVVNTDLVDVSEHMDHITTRTEVIKVRGWLDRSIEVRETPWGPIVSDAPLFKDLVNTPLAVRWIGHYSPSDELTAFLRAGQASTGSEFRKSFNNYAISGQNILYAHQSGELGQIFATRVPQYQRQDLETLIKSPQELDSAWSHLLTSTDFPQIVRSDYIVSANNQPPFNQPLLSLAFSLPDRAERMEELILSKEQWQLDDLKHLQMDAYSQVAHQLKEKIVEHLDQLNLGEYWGLPRADAQSLRDWDGFYNQDSYGAAVTQVVFYRLFDSIYARDLSPNLRVRSLNSDGIIHDMLHSHKNWLHELDETRWMQMAFQLSKDLAGMSTWGDFHRLELNHPLANVPFVGQRFRFKELPWSGSNVTLFKSAHSLSPTPHRVRYGTNSRHISDLSDPDANYFLLLGGQDGWVGSSNFMDQVPLWKDAQMIQIPLSHARVKETFKTHWPLN